MPAYNWPIPPSDEEGYSDTAVVLFCIPNSRTWRGLITGIVESLSWGWAWDGRTGSIKETQALGRDIFESMCIMDCVDFKRIADAMYVTIGEGEEAVEKSFTQVMYDSSQASNVTFQDLIDELGSSVEDVNDLFQLFNHIKSVLPGLPGLPAISVLAIWHQMQEARYRHSDLTLKAYMATSARHIGNALAPLTEDDGTTEENAVNDVLGEVAKIPWLTTAIVSLVDPSPAGEITFVVKMAVTAKSLYDRVTSVWENFRDKYINQVEDPQPVSSVVGQLAEIAARLSNAGGNINVNVSDCDDCGPETGGGATGDLPAEAEYLCQAGRWYIGLTIEALWTLINMQYAEDSPDDIEDTSTQWAVGAIVDITDWLNSRSAVIFSGEQVNENEDEVSYPITSPSTTFITDWGRQMALSQNDINALFQLLTDGLTRYETGQVYNPVRDTYIDTKINVNYQVDLMAYLTDIIDHQQDILDAITGANSASEARTDVSAVFEADISPPFLDGGVEYKPARRKLTDLLVKQGVFNRIFSGNINQVDIERYEWRVQAECAPFDFSCMPRPGGVNYGTPTTLFTGSAWNLGTYPVGTWATMTSEWQLNGASSSQRTQLTMDDNYTVEVEILSVPAGKNLQVFIRDCVNADIINGEYNQAGALYQGRVAELLIHSNPSEATNPGTFQIRIRRLT